MRRPVRIRNNKEILKEKCENKLDDGGNTLAISNSAENNIPEKENKFAERIVLKDQTNVLRNDQSPNTPSPPNSIKYGLRNNHSVDYKKLSEGTPLKDIINENKADVNKTTKPVTPKSSNKIFKSISNTKLSPDLSNNKVTDRKKSPALKIGKPIYNIHGNISRQRPSMSVEKKLAIYEFEVDENEPKVKPKKKRVRKVGEQKKLKKTQSKKITAKNVSECLKNAKKNPTLVLKRLEDKKIILPLQNRLSERNRTPALTTVEHNSLAEKKESLTRNEFEVPVLFHFHQDATPAKNNTSVTKPAFSAMSDDEEMNNKSQKGKVDSFFSNTKRSLEENEKLSQSSFSHDCSYDYQINASTPVKYNYNISFNNSSIENCFGFDEPEVFEEPLVSPIKNLEGSGSNQSGATTSTTPHIFQQKQDNNIENKEEIPVTQVIKLLKYGIDQDENILERKSRSSSGSTTPIFNDPAVEDEKPTNTTVKKDRNEKPVPRRSYERPAYLRKKKSFEEEDSDGGSDDDKGKKTFLPKKKNHGPTKKEKEEMHKWIKAFNSQCQEVEKFDLVVE